MAGAFIQVPENVHTWAGNQLFVKYGSFIVLLSFLIDQSVSKHISTQHPVNSKSLSTFPTSSADGWWCAR